MRKITAVLLIVTLMSFAIEPKVKITLTQNEFNRIQIHLLRVYNYLDQTNLPHGEVKAAQLQIDSAFSLLRSKSVIDSTDKK